MATASYWVVGEHTLGFIYEKEQPGWFNPLGRNRDGWHWVNGPVKLGNEPKRPATLEDFEKFRVSARGHLIGVPYDY